MNIIRWTPITNCTLYLPLCYQRKGTELWFGSMFSIPTQQLLHSFDIVINCTSLNIITRQQCQSLCIPTGRILSLSLQEWNPLLDCLHFITLQKWLFFYLDKNYLQRGKRILLVCYAGKHRSPSLLIGLLRYIYTKQHQSPSHSVYEWIKKLRYDTNDSSILRDGVFNIYKLAFI